MRAWSLAWRTACGSPVFREFAEATDGVDRRTVRAGRRAARRGEAAPDAASARVAVARARAVRAEVEGEADPATGWRVAQGAIGALWLLLAVSDASDADAAGLWRVALGVSFLAVAARSPARRFARAREAETRNRAVLRAQGVAYPPEDDTVFIRPPLTAVVAAAVVTAASALAVAGVLSAVDHAFPPKSSDLLPAAAFCLLLTSIWAVQGWRRTDPYAEPPSPVGP